jgi:hypothetical protein
MLVRKTKEQKLYLLKLKSEITDFTENFKKRYRLFPWSGINKVKKIDLLSSTPIVVNGTSFTTMELLKEINNTKSKIQSKLKPSYYNFILKAYSKDAMNKTGKELTTVYKTYQDQLQVSFKGTKEDLNFCLSALKEINKVLKKTEVKTESSIIEESEVVSTMINWYDFVTESNEYIDLRDFVLECYEDISLDDYEEDTITEGANIDATKEVIDLTKKYKSGCKKAKKFIKDKKYNEAKNELKHLIAYIDSIEACIRSLESTTGSVILGAFAKRLLTLCKSIIPVGVPTAVSGMYTAKGAKALLNGQNEEAISKALVGTVFGTAAGIAGWIINIKALIDNIVGIIDGLRDPKTKTMDAINVYKNELIKYTKDLRKSVEALVKNCDKKKAEYEAYLNSEKKKEKEVKESADFLNAKKELYKACSRGEITLEEREELYKDLQDKMYIKETTDLDTSIDGSTKVEKFNQVRSELYSRCSSGLISVEERELLITKAHDMIFTEADETEKASEGLDSKEVDKNVSDAIKDNGSNVEKEIDKITK